MALFFNIASFFGSLVGIVTFPQAWKLFSSKSSKDVSVLTYFCLFVIGSVLISYSFSIKDIPGIATNFIGIICIVAVIVGYFKYKDK